jgi:hypothetical protein
MAEGDLIQQSQLPDRTSGTDAQSASVSADNAASVEHMRLLQGRAQQRINQGRHDIIGSEP